MFHKHHFLFTIYILPLRQFCSMRPEPFDLLLFPYVRKVNSDLWGLFIATVPLSMALISTVIKKINFILNALGSKFDLDVEVLKVNQG